MILLFSFSLGLAVWKLIQSIWMRTLCPTIRMLSFCFCMHNNVSVWLIGETCIDKFFEWSNLKFLQSDIPPIEIFYWYFFWMVHGRELFLPFRDSFFFCVCVGNGVINSNQIFCFHWTRLEALNRSLFFNALIVLLEFKSWSVKNLINWFLKLYTTSLVVW